MPLARAILLTDKTDVPAGCEGRMGQRTDYRGSRRSLRVVKKLFVEKYFEFD
jgi:hypothetical protein